MAGPQPISEYMTKVVHTIDLETTLETAHMIMRDREIRHLPVMDEDKLVGVISERELEMLRAFPMIDMDVASASDAMADNAYIVGPDTPLTEVVREMAERKVGSVLVATGQKVEGIFTTTDALRIVDRLLAG